ncbi:unnamed protein product [Cuscuta campestris]|uniref:Uncharacterized protein n=1 Tax=Cuscuta campestris TaxID=132261 RepID=A0A484MZI5_9ASTE|nr:unnamed protein product [Cuscuta campestris]
MEGLIPYLVHALKKQRPPHHHALGRCLSDASNRSYHLLVGSDSPDGSSRRRIQISDEFRDRFSDQRSPRNVIRSFSNRAAAGSMIPSAAAAASMASSGLSRSSGHQASFSIATTVNRRR